MVDFQTLTSQATQKPPLSNKNLPKRKTRKLGSQTPILAQLIPSTQFINARGISPWTGELLALLQGKTKLAGENGYRYMMEESYWASTLSL